jgi:hypothetical protein
VPETWKPNASRQNVSAGSISDTLSLKKPSLIMRLSRGAAVCVSARGLQSCNGLRQSARR